MKQFSTQLLFFIAVAFLFISCSQDPIDSENENQLYLEQIDFKTTTQADVFKSLKTAKSQNKSSQNDFVSYSSSDLYYDPITNSSERLAVIPANTPLPNTYNRILTATINDSVRTVLFQMLPKIGHHGDSLYTGKVIISDLNGHFIKGYSIKNGNQISYYKLRLNKPHKNGGTPCAEHTKWNGDCYFCQQTLDEVIIQAPPSNGDNLTTISSLFDDLQFDNGANGYDTGMNWDYGSGSGGGGSPATIVNIVNQGPKINPKEELKCFDQSKEAKITIYVQQPKENTNDLIGPNEVGHAFVGISQNGIERYFGFYPESNSSTIGIAIGNTYNSIFRDNSNSEFHVSISETVNPTQLQSIIRYSSESAVDIKYNLNNYACTDFAIYIGNLAGLNLPSTTVTKWPFSGRSPGQLGQEIRIRTDRSITRTKSNAPQKKGGC